MFSLRLTAELTPSLDLSKFGIDCIAMDFRKECRRRPKRNRCAFYNDTEKTICGLASVAELLVARNVFGINLSSTVTFSSGVGSNIDIINTWDSEQDLLGPIRKVPWHPRLLWGVAKSMHESRWMLLHLLSQDVAPVLQRILADYGHHDVDQASIVDELEQVYSESKDSLFSKNFGPSLSEEKEGLPPTLPLSELEDNPSQSTLNATRESMRGVRVWWEAVKGERLRQARSQVNTAMALTQQEDSGSGDL